MGDNTAENIPTTKATYNGLKQFGGLSVHADEISSSLRDATKLSWDIECRSFWVDTLWIVQDDDERSKPRDAIYRQAILATVTAD